MVEDFQSKAAEMMKKILTVGVGTIFLTEESLRALVTEFKLPKEFLSGLLESANRTRADFLKSLSSEMMSQVMERVDLRELVQQLLRDNTIQLNVQLQFTSRSTDQNLDRKKKKKKT